MQKIELNQLTENKVIKVQLKKGQGTKHNVSSMTFNGQYSSKSTWFVDKVPVLEITNTVPGSWRIIVRNNRLAGYYFRPREKNSCRWEVKFVYE